MSHGGAATRLPDRPMASVGQSDNAHFAFHDGDVSFPTDEAVLCSVDRLSTFLTTIVATDALTALQHARVRSVLDLCYIDKGDLDELGLPLGTKARLLRALHLLRKHQLI